MHTSIVGSWGTISLQRNHTTGVRGLPDLDGSLRLVGSFSFSFLTDPLLVGIRRLQLEGRQTYTSPGVFGIQGSHRGLGALLSADLPDWCSEVSALSFEIPLTLRALGGTAHVAVLFGLPQCCQEDHTPIDLAHSF